MDAGFRLHPYPNVGTKFVSGLNDLHRSESSSSAFVLLQPMFQRSLVNTVVQLAEVLVGEIKDDPMYRT